MSNLFTCELRAIGDRLYFSVSHLNVVKTKRGHIYFLKNENKSVPFSIGVEFLPAWR